MLGGVLCLRGYLPVMAGADSGDAEAAHRSGASLRGTGLATSITSTSPWQPSPPPVLLCQGGRDRVAPTEWARAAATTLREQRRARAREVEQGDTCANTGRVELLVCEDRGHDLAPDDVWRARSWLRSRLERRDGE